MADPKWRLFIDHKFEEEAPEWIPYLPSPGTFKHPSYGDIEFTSERNRKFVSNFSAGIYQTRIPIDGEHLTKQSGALGWITGMRTNENGSADAQVEWTDRGKTMIADKRFRYVSPEIYPNWTDPATSVEYEDVAIGAALTTRPFFKESHLRPLIANEHGLFAATEDFDVESPTLVFLKLSEDKHMAEKKEEAQVTLQQFTEVQQQLSEVKTALAESEQKRTEAEGAAQKYQEALDATTARIAKMEEANRIQRFTNLVDGHDGPRWLGEIDAHVKVLNKFAEAFGEDDEGFTAYVTQQQAVANQVKDNQMFQELGSDKSGKTKSAQAEMDTRARKLMTEDGKLTYAQAFSIVLERDPALYDRHLKGE